MNNNQNSLKVLYNLPYDESGVESSLIRWYNNVINKTIDELDIGDVARMIRQDILKDIAVNKAIEFFIKNPLAGEMYNGQLLNNLVSVELSVLKAHKNNNILLDTINRLKLQDIVLEFNDEETKKDFNTDLVKLENMLKK